MDSFARALERTGAATAELVLAHLPQLLGALALLLLGWLLARLLRMATRRGVLLLDALIARNGGQLRWRIGNSASVLGTVVYGVVLLFFVAAATHTLGLQTFTDWLARVLDHLPTLAAGLLIVAAGSALSGFVGADQIGLKVTWIAILAAVLVASVMGGVTIAVSLGARSYVANLIGAHYLRQALRPGQRVRVAGHEGLIVEVTATSLVLETREGRVVLPGKVYNDEAIVHFARNDGD
jgi:hypothetical protein